MSFYTCCAIFTHPNFNAFIWKVYTIKGKKQRLCNIWMSYLQKFRGCFKSYTSNDIGRTDLFLLADDFTCRITYWDHFLSLGKRACLCEHQGQNNIKRYFKIKYNDSAIIVMSFVVGFVQIGDF